MDTPDHQKDEHVGLRGNYPCTISGSKNDENEAAIFLAHKEKARFTGKEWFEKLKAA